MKLDALEWAIVPLGVGLILLSTVLYEPARRLTRNLLPYGEHESGWEIWVRAAGVIGGTAGLIAVLMWL